MHIAINDKGGDCWINLKFSLIPIIDDNGQSQANPQDGSSKPRDERLRVRIGQKKLKRN